MKPELPIISSTEFDHCSTAIAKYIRAGNIFTLMLKSGEIIHHCSQEDDLFEQWLLDHEITNIKSTTI